MSDLRRRGQVVGVAGVVLGVGEDLAAHDLPRGQTGRDRGVVEDVEALLEHLDRVHRVGVVGEARAEVVAGVGRRRRATPRLERTFELVQPVVEVLVGVGGVAGGVDVDGPPVTHGRAAYGVTFDDVPTGDTGDCRHSGSRGECSRPIPGVSRRSSRL